MGLAPVDAAFVGRTFVRTAHIYNVAASRAEMDDLGDYPDNAPQTGAMRRVIQGALPVGKIMGRKETPKMERKPDVQFTPERKEIYLRYVEEHGTLYAAARAAGVDYTTVVNHRDKDPEFKRRETAAKEEHTDMLVREATRRAVHGTKRAVIGGKDKDRVILYEQEYSDGLMQTLLRSKRGEFGNQGSEAANGGAGGSGSGGGVLIVPQAPHSVTEWTRLYGEKAKGTTNQPEKKA